MISNFEADVKCLQDPYLISQFFSLSNIEKVPQLYNFWKWGALFFAIITTFSSLVRKIKLIFIYVRTTNPSPEPLFQYLNEDFDFSDDDDDDDDECSSVSSNEDKLTHTVFSRDQQLVDQDFTVVGSSFYLSKQGQKSNLRLTEFMAGKSVVKLWDMNKQLKMSNLMFFRSNGVVLTAYDTRMTCQFPVICAEWGKGEVVGIDGGGVENVYVRDEVGGVLKVGDIRKVKTMVEMVTVTDIDGGMRWDAGAAIVDDDYVDCSK